jgi:predicted RND superfamily exporter protein
MQYNGQNANFGKLISGRLLQAGWHTETELKRYAIRESIKNLLFVKNDFKKNFQKNSSGLSELLLDVLMLLFCEYSYNSTFLQKEIKETIEEKLLFTENTSILELLGLMASINRFIEPVQRESMIKKILDKMPELNLLKEEEVSYLIIMDMIEKNNKELKKTLRNRINKKLKIQKTDYKKFIK